jgi:dihydropteroate synthase
MLDEGADILDLGAYSSRPGAAHISLEEEGQRLIPAVEAIHKHFPEALLSVDTFRSQIAIESIHKGAAMINDISGGEMDNKMFETIAQLQVPYFLMHMKGTPQNMQQQASYDDLMNDMIDYFSTKVMHLQDLGVADIIIDPGFGFGKTVGHNYEIVRRMKDFAILGHPILAGVSRKSMIYKPLEITAAEALRYTVGFVICHFPLYATS